MYLAEAWTPMLWACGGGKAVGVKLRLTMSYPTIHCLLFDSSKSVASGYLWEGLT